MALSTLSLAFTQNKKSVVPTGVIAIRESIAVTVVGGAVFIADGLVLKIQDRNNHGETVAIGQLSTWTTSSANATGTLSLNTAEAIAAFENVGNVGSKGFNIMLYTVTGNTLMANGIITIMNFPSAVTEAPLTLDQSAQLDTLQDSITDLQDGKVAYADFAPIALLTGAVTLNIIKAKINEMLTAAKG